MSSRIFCYIVLPLISVSGTSFAQTNYGVRYHTPDAYSFSAIQVNSEATNCTNLNRLIAKYTSSGCGAVKNSALCQMIVTQVKTEQLLDIQNANPMDDFSRLYSLELSGSAVDSSNASLRFDEGYVSSYNVNPTEIGNSNKFRFGLGLSPDELDLETKIQAPNELTLVLFQGKPYFKIGSKIRVCAFEGSRLSILGQATVDIKTYHPSSQLAYSIVNSTFRKASTIASRSDLNDAQKNYLLGIAAGDALKQLSSTIQSSAQLDEISVGLYNVIIDQSKKEFSLYPVLMDSNLAARLLDPGISIPNSDIKVSYKAL